MDSVGDWISLVGIGVSLVILLYSRSQLRLAKRESLRNPQLHVEEVSWLDAKDYEGVQELAGVQAKLSEWENMTDEERESYAPPSGEDENEHFIARGARMYEARNRYAGPPNLGALMYSGPLPDLVLSFRLSNRGRRAARDIEGWMYFKQDMLQPVKPPGFDGRASNGSSLGARLHRGSPYREGVKFRSLSVPPSSAEEVKTFYVAFAKKGSGGKCDAKLVFSNSDGDYVEKDLSLDV